MKLKTKIQFNLSILICLFVVFCAKLNNNFNHQNYKIIWDKTEKIVAEAIDSRPQTTPKISKRISFVKKVGNATLQTSNGTYLQNTNFSHTQTNESVNHTSNLSFYQNYTHPSFYNYTPAVQPNYTHPSFYNYTPAVENNYTYPSFSNYTPAVQPNHTYPSYSNYTPAFQPNYTYPSFSNYTPSVEHNNTYPSYYNYTPAVQPNHTYPSYSNYTSEVQPNYTYPSFSNYTPAFQPNYTYPSYSNYTSEVQPNYTHPSYYNHTPAVQPNYTYPSYSNYTPAAEHNNTYPSYSNYTPAVQPSYSNYTPAVQQNYTQPSYSNYTAVNNSSTNQTKFDNIIPYNFTYTNSFVVNNPSVQNQNEAYPTFYPQNSNTLNHRNQKNHLKKTNDITKSSQIQNGNNVNLSSAERVSSNNIPSVAQNKIVIKPVIDEKYTEVPEIKKASNTQIENKKTVEKAKIIQNIALSNTLESIKPSPLNKKPKIALKETNNYQMTAREVVKVQNHQESRLGSKSNYQIPVSSYAISSQPQIRFFPVNYVKQLSPAGKAALEAQESGE